MLLVATGKETSSKTDFFVEKENLSMVTEAAIDGNSNVVWILQSWEKLLKKKAKVEQSLQFLDDDE